MYELYDSNEVINLRNLRGKPDCIFGVDVYYVCCELNAVALVMICTYDVMYKYTSWWIMNNYDASPNCATRVY